MRGFSTASTLCSTAVCKWRIAINFAQQFAKCATYKLSSGGAKRRNGVGTLCYIYCLISIRNKAAICDKGRVTIISEKDEKGVKKPDIKGGKNAQIAADKK